MLIMSPDTITYGADPRVDPGPEWPLLLTDLQGPRGFGKECCKWTSEVKIIEDLLPELRRGLYIADTVPRGPTLVQIPHEHLLETVPSKVITSDLYKERPIVSTLLVNEVSHLEEVAAILLQARNPLIITQHTCSENPKDVGNFVLLAEMLGAPVFECWCPLRESFPRNHPLYFLSGSVEKYLVEADVVLVAGSSAPWHSPSTPLNANTTVIVMDEDPLRPRNSFWGYRTDVCVPGDIASNVRQLVSIMGSKLTPELAYATGQRGKQWEQVILSHRSSLRLQREAELEIFAANHSSGIHAIDLYRTVHHELPNGTALVDEVIASFSHFMENCFGNLLTDEKKTFKHIRGWFGGLGTSIPTALGVKLAYDRLWERKDFSFFAKDATEVPPVVCLVGDGAFHYAPVVAAFGLAQQYGLGIIVVVCNNAGFQSQGWNVQKYFPQGAAVRTNNFIGRDITPTPEYALLAQAYGGYGEKVTSVSQLQQSIQKALIAIRNGQFVVLDVLMNP